jgi:hypothetical protein
MKNTFCIGLVLICLLANGCAVGIPLLPALMFGQNSSPVIVKPLETAAE